MNQVIYGQCLCGDVEFDIDKIEIVDVCHCTSCRRWTGSAFIGADVDGEVRFSKSASLKWFESSNHAKRGFCSTCGSSLFFRFKDKLNLWAISAGTLNMPAGQRLSKEIFVDEKPDYYDFAGDQVRLSSAEFLAQKQGEKHDR